MIAYIGIVIATNGPFVRLLLLDDSTIDIDSSSPRYEFFDLGNGAVLVEEQTEA